MKPNSLFVVFAALIGSALSVQASTVTVIVPVSGMDQPWFANGSLNPSFQFGYQDGIGPAFVDSSTGISFDPGGTLVITYLSGTTNADVLSGASNVDGNGYIPGTPVVPYAANNGPGTSGNHFPSLYMSPYPIYLNALVATFADSSGDIVGTPFAVDDGPVSVLVPVGATRLQLGINDDILYDNGGVLSVSVTGPDPPVPEPASLALISFPLGMLAIFECRKRRSRPVS
jgi:hypothetical protein